MKTMLSLALLFSLNVSAETNYDLSKQSACVLQIMKKTPASLVVACGSETFAVEKTLPFAQMPNSAAFVVEAREAFLNSLGGERSSLRCLEFNDQTAYIYICNRLN